MSKMQRTKGSAGEREAAALLACVTGCDIRRRVRQHDGDTDLEGLPGWSLEIKRHAAAPRGEIARWWRQACEQAHRTGARPLLLYRPDRGAWRAVWAPDDDPAHAVEADPATWWRLTQPWHADRADSPT